MCICWCVTEIDYRMHGATIKIFYECLIKIRCLSHDDRPSGAVGTDVRSYTHTAHGTPTHPHTHTHTHTLQCSVSADVISAPLHCNMTPIWKNCFSSGCLELLNQTAGYRFKFVALSGFIRFQVMLKCEIHYVCCIIHTSFHLIRRHYVHAVYLNSK